MVSVCPHVQVAGSLCKAADCWVLVRTEVPLPRIWGRGGCGTSWLLLSSSVSSWCVHVVSVCVLFPGVCVYMFVWCSPCRGVCICMNLCVFMGCVP